MGNKMQKTIWIVFGRDGIHRMTKTHPALDKGELSFQINLKWDNQLFETPIFRAEIEIDQKNKAVELDIKELEEQIKGLKGDKSIAEK